MISIQIATPLCNGITLAYFHVSGITQVERDRLRSLTSGGDKAEDANLINLVSISSGPESLLKDSLLMALSAGLTHLNTKNHLMFGNCNLFQRDRQD